ncbi:hypothetical protein CHS0354_018871 [Potamilus streckersoni]|uniref:ABC-type glutathione-S-conjugate transporter n=1 Tax=Potamilus streckersoni TaxID=2493646 RepID=A0AAE0SC11_9BIVA|nr:hypothetical protein CHS0354_018871 [Potamilus streckersoni]
MDAFCGGDEFWNASQTWGETATWPQFTECFQNTVLVWITGGWLWLASPFYMAYIASCKSNPLHNCWRTFAKLILTLLLLAICIVEFSLEASDRLKQDKSLLEAAFMGPVFEAATMVLVIIYIVLEKRKGFITSGVLFIYWALALLTYIIPFYTKIITQYNDELLKVCLFYIYFGLTICQVVLYSFADSPPYTVHENTCPEMQSSFLSRVSFWWMNRLLLTGYRKPLTETDIFSLNPREQSLSVIPRFERRLQQEKEIVRQYRNKNILINGDDEEKENDELSESSPLLTTPESGRSRRKSTKDLRKISLMKVLIRTFGCELLLSHIWKLLYDVLIFISPNLLRLFIEFIEDRTMMVWKGYILACAFFCVIVMQSFFFHQLNHQSTSLSLRVRSALISAVFKKSLTISGKARKESTIGEIVNLMSVDAEHIRDVLQYMWAMWSSPMQIIVSLVFLYQTLGPSMFAGFGVLVILIPINGFIMNKVQKLQDQQMTQKDNRIKLLTEILNGIKILKLYAWELSFRDKLQAIRNIELKILMKSGFIWTFMGFSWTVAPFLVGLVTFATYIFVAESHRLDAKTAFVAISLFNILRFAINMTPMVIAEIIKAVVSVKRLEKFLNNEDLDDTCVFRETLGQTITIENGTFTWDNNLDPCLRDISLSIPAGSLVAVVGQVGSGKSSLISAILGEMEKLKGQVNVKGSLAYVPQQAWIQNATIQDNILLGNTMVASRYEDVLEACALNPDLDILQARDMTEIGEKGINLSGGQKQRVSLARAIYFDSNIYLLDDPLSAVDSNVGKHIFDKVIGSEGLLKNKTRVLVTHGVHWLPRVDMIVVMSGGTISETGSYDELMEYDGAFAQFLRTYLVNADKTDDEDPEVLEFKAKTLQRLVSVHSDGSSGSGIEEEFKRIKRASESEGGASDKQTVPHASSMDAETGKHKLVISKDIEIPQSAEKNKLIEEETVEVGTVKWSVIVAYARAVGIKFTVLIFMLYGCFQATAVYASIWLSDWTADPQLQNLTVFPANSAERRNRNDYFLGVYGGLGGAQAVFVLVFSIILMFRMIHASAHLHLAMLTNILRCPLEFFDTTPIGRIVNRFTQDIDSIDNELPMQFHMWLDALFVCLSTLVVISYSTPIFLSVILPIGILYLVAQRFYIPTSRQLKRLESKTRSPIYNNFSESLTGASVIRAFGVQDKFIKESEKRVDKNQQFAFANYSANRWLGFRLEFTGAVVVLAAAVFAVLERDNISGAIVGLSISYALQITENLNWMVRMTSDLETNIVAVERVQEYTKRPTEAPLSTGVYPYFGWPNYGKVEFNSYSTRYREGLDLVLKDITVSVRPGEKVGIVGRTGAGKSSMTLALFRLIEPAGGQIMVDGQDISVLGLHDVRSKLTILPQEPVLFSGSLRMNLDPLDEHTDSAIWMALEQAHLKSFVQSVPDNIQYECGEGGQNLSVGQRQLICLARSLLRKSKILVLDEATAAVDMETDDLIQKTIRKEFANCTVLTIAHRLNTVMDYDRILVLDKGEIKEFDSPNSLLSRPDSLFYQMAKDAKLISDAK